MEMHIIKDLALLDDLLDELLAKLPTDIMTEDEWDQWLEAQTQAQTADLAVLSSKINAVVLRHVLIPTGLAARRTSLLNKIHNMLHAFMIDVGSWARVFRLCGLIPSVCTDQGVESLISGCSLTTMDLQKTPDFPPKLDNAEVEDQMPLLSDEARAPLVDEASAPEATPSSANITMPNSLWVPGGLHVIHNAIEAILDGMDHSQHWLKQLKTIAGFLKHKDLREMFISQCLSGAAASLQRKMMVMP